MMRFRFILSFAMTAVLMQLSLSGCDAIFDDDDCDDDDGRIYASLNWRLAREASPDAMSVVFFPHDADESSWRYELPANADSTLIAYLPDGQYDALVFNPEPDFVHFTSDEKKSELYAFCVEETAFTYSDGTEEESLPAATEGATQPLVHTISSMWTAQLTGLHVPDDPEEDLLFTFSPKAVTPHYSYTATDVQHPENILSAGAVLSGMSGRLLLWNAVRDSSPSALTLPIEVDDNELEGDFYTFGPCADTKVHQVLYFYFRLRDGRKFYYAFDVTDQVQSAPDPMEVEIVVNGIPIPAPEAPQGGGSSPFQVDVDGWTTTVINIDS